MKELVFIDKRTQEKAVLKTDIMDGNQRFTVMYMEGVKNTNFEKILPFNVGTVFDMQDLEKWFELQQGVLSGYIYGGEEIVSLGVEEFDLTINPTVTGEGSASVLVKGEKEGAENTVETVALENSTPKILKIIEGWKYTITSANDGVLSGDTSSFTASENKSINLTITFSED